MFEISKEMVPVAPLSRSRSGRLKVYPFADMAVGQHFDAPRDMGRAAGGNDKRQSAVSSCARSYVRKHNPGAWFVTRTIDAGTVRCWRIA